MAGTPVETVAQSGPGQARGLLGAWIQEARAGAFHRSALAGTPENPAGLLAAGPGTGNGGSAWRPLPPMPDSAVSERRVFAFALAGATLPLVPAMAVDARDAWGDGAGEYEQLAAMIAGTAAALVLTPVAAIAAGGRTSLKTFAGTVLGAALGLPVMVFASALPSGEFWVVPFYSLTIATITTIAATR